jgi:hypothetical protein
LPIESIQALKPTRPGFPQSDSGRSTLERFRALWEVIGVTPMRFARTHRFAATVLAIDPAGTVDWL